MLRFCSWWKSLGGGSSSCLVACTTCMHVQIRVALVSQASLTVKHMASASFSLSNDFGALLLCPGMYPLTTASQEAESSRKLTHLLNAVTDALVWVIAKSGISSQQQSVRLANLLMLLSHVRHIRYKPVGPCSGGVWAGFVQEPWGVFQFSWLSGGKHSECLSPPSP